MDIIPSASAFRQAYEIIKTLLKLKMESDVLKKLSELQAVLIEAQTSQLSLLEQNSSLVKSRDALEREIAVLKDWETESKRYTLHTIERGIFVYALKEQEAQGEPAHWLCPHCFSEKKKGILNRIEKTNTMDYHYKCSCGYELIIFNRTEPEYIQRRQSSQPKDQG